MSTLLKHWYSLFTTLIIVFAIVSASSGQAPSILLGHHDTVAALAFSPDGKFLYSAGADGQLFVWEVEAVKQVHRLPSLSSTPRAIAGTAGGGFVREEAYLRVSTNAYAYRASALAADAAMLYASFAIGPSIIFWMPERVSSPSLP